MYGVWAAYDALFGNVALWAGAASLVAWLIITYSAVFPGAIADVIQSRAQVSLFATLPHHPIHMIAAVFQSRARLAIESLYRTIAPYIELYISPYVMLYRADDDVIQSRAQVSLFALPPPHPI
jgi:hypothetical protein